jgi:tetratricopeptide (TPR) repeat protein
MSPFRPSRAPSRPKGKPIASARRGDPRSAASAASAASAGSAASAEQGLALRLVIGRDGIGLELARPVRLECLTVTELTATLPGIRFPVDVSGGVPRFRHRRGRLRTLQVEVGARLVERWAAPRLLGIVGARPPEVWIGVRPAGAVVGVAARVDAEEEKGDGGVPVVAFDLDVICERGDLLFIVSRARGADLPAPATAIAIACADAIFRGAAKREGSLLRLRDGANALARELFPEAGARAPDGDAVHWASIGADADTWIAHAVHDALSAPASDEALRAREVALMLRDVDDALVAGELERARTLSLEALERAPRHSEIIRRVLEIDLRASERAEAALAMLAEASFRHRPGEGGGEPSEACFGTGPGELLARTGDVDAALASLEHAGDAEPTPALAARAFERAARLTPDAEDAGRWLDRSLARAPRSTTARWLRVAKRLQLGRIEDALSDVEHLEALARGNAAKHLVWWRAGLSWQAAGLTARASTLFEHALRYAPEEPRALAGLGQALVDQGREQRGVAALTRAIELAEMGSLPTSGMLLALARALAERLDDLPAAIARVAAVPADGSEGPVARGLEGRWRARLGDVAGAALAFARLREIAASLPERASAIAPEIVTLLLEGAELQRLRLQDLRGAQRYLAAALRLKPHDSELRRRYRELGALLVRGEGPAPPPAHETPESRVEELSQRLRADPRDDATADELASLLESLQRGHELLALLSARLEDATPERRRALAPRARAALERLAVEAEAAGRLDEAALYRSAMQGLLR